MDKYEVKTLKGYMEIIQGQYETLIRQGWEVVSPFAILEFKTCVSFTQYIIILRKEIK